MTLDEEETYPLAHGRVNMIQEGRPPRKIEEATTLQAYMATKLNIEAPYHLWNSEVAITFSQKDHPPAIPRPGHAPLVLEAQIGGYDMSPF